MGIEIKIRWSPSLEEAIAVYSIEYHDADAILRADMLQDAIGLLEEEYNKVLEAGLGRVS